jgi:CDP-diglyceride synthetase
MHLFIITAFIAIVAPFGALFYSALKRALKAEQFSEMLTNGGVIDRVDGILITGLFLFIYINYIIYQEQDAVKIMQEMILSLSP